MTSNTTRLPPLQSGLPLRFVASSLVATCLVSFFVGRGARMFIDQRLDAISLSENHMEQRYKHRTQHDLDLPAPAVKGRKEIPQTIYTAKHFDSVRPVTTSSLFLSKDGQEGTQDSVDNTSSIQKGDVDSSQNKTIDSFYLEDDLTAVIQGIEEEEHLPAGQHLLLDFDNVDASFLNSQKLLASAMVEMVYECGLTMLSYHCFGLEPSGVSCAGVLLESHVAFHTWPEEGVITMDLFTCGANSLLPMVPMIEDLFARPRQNDPTTLPPKMIWAYKRRGFSDLEEDMYHPSSKKEANDLFAHPLGLLGMGFKTEITSPGTSTLDHFHVFDVIREPMQSVAAYEKSISSTNSYEYKNPDFFRPDRLVFSRGSLKLRRSGEAATYESLVHPAMFSHPSPQRVAIVGAGEGAALREVLKHKTVEEVTLIAADEGLVTMAKTHLADWNDCSDLVGSAPSCFDDPRVTIFSNRESEDWLTETLFLGVKPNLFDVIVIDDLGVPRALPVSLQTDIKFVRSLFESLSYDGVVAIRTVDDRFIHDSPTRLRADSKLESLFETLERVGFQEIRDYKESHGGLRNHRDYVVAFKSSSTAANWLSGEATIDLQLKKRSLPTVDGESPFRYFDGPTMLSYLSSSPAVEALDCEQGKQPQRCSHHRIQELSAPKVAVSRGVPYSKSSESARAVGNASGVVDSESVLSLEIPAREEPLVCESSGSLETAGADIC